MTADWLKNKAMRPLFDPYHLRVVEPRALYGIHTTYARIPFYMVLGEAYDFQYMFVVLALMIDGKAPGRSHATMSIKVGLN